MPRMLFERVPRAAPSLSIAVALAAAALALAAGLGVATSKLAYATAFSQGRLVPVYGSNGAGDAGSGRVVIDVHVVSPLTAAGWLLDLGIALAAFALAVWGLWAAARYVHWIRAREGARKTELTMNSVASWSWNVGVFGLAAYVALVHTTNFREWRLALESAGGVSPVPLPEYDPAQIPLGIALFASVAVVNLVVVLLVRRPNAQEWRSITRP